MPENFAPRPPFASSRSTPPSSTKPGSSVRIRVVSGLAVIIVAFAGLTLYSITLHRSTVDDIGLINSSYLPLTLGTAEIRSTQLVFNTLLDRLADNPNQSVTREWIDAARRFRPATLRRLRAIVDKTLEKDIPDEEAAFISEMGRRLVEVERRYLANESKFQELYGLMSTGKNDEARHHIEGLKRVERLLDRVLEGVRVEVETHITELAEAAQSEGERANLGLAILTGATFLVAVLVIVSTNRLLGPLKTLQLAVARVARGEVNTHLTVGSDDEIGALARGFNRMTDALAERDQMLIRSERLATAGKMAAQVTHEIRNPLSSLGLNVELLEDELTELPEASEAKDLLRAMQDEIERLTGITESYLRFARLPVPNPRFDDIGAVVKAALAFMETEIGEADVHICDLIDEDIGPVYFDTNQIRQALVNLIRNAREAMPEGGVLTVTAHAVDDAVEVSVADTGPGVSAEHLGQIFDSFFSTKSSGTGLGLPLVRQICLAHGGDVRYETDGEAGARFVISLPRQRDTEPPENEDTQ